MGNNESQPPPERRFFPQTNSAPIRASNGANVVAGNNQNPAQNSQQPQQLQNSSQPLIHPYTGQPTPHPYSMGMPHPYQIQQPSNLPFGLQPLNGYPIMSPVMVIQRQPHQQQQQPVGPPPASSTQSMQRVRNDVILKKDSVKFAPCHDPSNPQLYSLEFVIDAQADCTAEVYFCANEIVDEHNNTLRLEENVIPRASHQHRSLHLRQGVNQTVRFGSLLQFGVEQKAAAHDDDDAFDFGLIQSSQQLQYMPGTNYFPLVIVLRRAQEHNLMSSSNAPEQFVQSLTTYFAISSSIASKTVKFLRQKAKVGSKSFILEEIFGLEASTSSKLNKHKAHGGVSHGSLDNDEDDDDEAPACVICLSEPRMLYPQQLFQLDSDGIISFLSTWISGDTTVYPCKHFVLCHGCSVTLGKQGVHSKCPVCRCRVERFLQIAVGNDST